MWPCYANEYTDMLIRAPSCCLSLTRILLKETPLQISQISQILQISQISIAEILLQMSKFHEEIQTGRNSIVNVADTVSQILQISLTVEITNVKFRLEKTPL